MNNERGLMFNPLTSQVVLDSNSCELSCAFIASFVILLVG